MRISLIWITLFGLLKLGLTESRSQCVDIEGRKVTDGSSFVPKGHDYCTRCICDGGQGRLCVAELCLPPRRCKSFRKVPRTCCKFRCLDDTRNNVDLQHRHKGHDSQGKKRKGNNCRDFRGNVIWNGQEFSPKKRDPCLRCTCVKGHRRMCNFLPCADPPTNCSRYEKVDGECCKYTCLDDQLRHRHPPQVSGGPEAQIRKPKKSRNCKDRDGHVIDEGAIFAPGADPCLKCTCVNGKQKMCVAVTCQRPKNCSWYELVPGQCCKFKCLDVRKDNSLSSSGNAPEAYQRVSGNKPMHCTDQYGRVIPEGRTYTPNRYRKCSICSCIRGQPKKCRAVQCVRPKNCKNYVRLPDSCCRFRCLDGTTQPSTTVALGCIDSQGKRIKEGEVTATTRHDRCVRCRCVGGRLEQCMMVNCRTPRNCSSYRSLPGQCCLYRCNDDAANQNNIITMPTPESRVKPVPSSCKDSKGLSVGEGSLYSPYESAPCVVCTCSRGRPRSCHRKRCNDDPLQRCARYTMVRGSCCKYRCVQYKNATDSSNQNGHCAHSSGKIVKIGALLRLPGDDKCSECVCVGRNQRLCRAIDCFSLAKKCRNRKIHPNSCCGFVCFDKVKGNSEFFESPSIGEPGEEVESAVLTTTETSSGESIKQNKASSFGGTDIRNITSSNKDQSKDRIIGDRVKIKGKVSGKNSPIEIKSGFDLESSKRNFSKIKAGVTEFTEPKTEKETKERNQNKKNQVHKKNEAKIGRNYFGFTRAYADVEIGTTSDNFKYLNFEENHKENDDVITFEKLSESSNFEENQPRTKNNYYVHTKPYADVKSELTTENFNYLNSKKDKPKISDVEKLSYDPKSVTSQSKDKEHYYGYTREYDDPNNEVTTENFNYFNSKEDKPKTSDVEKLSYVPNSNKNEAINGESYYGYTRVSDDSNGRKDKVSFRHFYSKEGKNEDDGNKNFEKMSKSSNSKENSLKEKYNEYTEAYVDSKIGMTTESLNQLYSPENSPSFLENVGANEKTAVDYGNLRGDDENLNGNVSNAKDNEEEMKNSYYERTGDINGTKNGMDQMESSRLGSIDDNANKTNYDGMKLDFYRHLQHNGTAEVKYGFKQNELHPITEVKEHFSPSNSKENGKEAKEGVTLSTNGLMELEHDKKVKIRNDVLNFSRNFSLNFEKSTLENIPIEENLAQLNETFNSTDNTRIRNSSYANSIKTEQPEVVSKDSIVDTIKFLQQKVQSMEKENYFLRDRFVNNFQNNVNEAKNLILKMFSKTKTQKKTRKPEIEDELLNNSTNFNSSKNQWNETEENINQLSMNVSEDKQNLSPKLIEKSNIAEIPTSTDDSIGNSLLNLEESGLKDAKSEILEFTESREEIPNGTTESVEKESHLQNVLKSKMSTVRNQLAKVRESSTSNSFWKGTGEILIHQKFNNYSQSLLNKSEVYYGLYKTEVHDSDEYESSDIASKKPLGIFKNETRTNDKVLDLLINFKNKVEKIMNSSNRVQRENKRLDAVSEELNKKIRESIGFKDISANSSLGKEILKNQSSENLKRDVETKSDSSDTRAEIFNKSKNAGAGILLKTNVESFANGTKSDDMTLNLLKKFKDKVVGMMNASQMIQKTNKKLEENFTNDFQKKLRDSISFKDQITNQTKTKNSFISAIGTLNNISRNLQLEITNVFKNSTGSFDNGTKPNNGILSLLTKFKDKVKKIINSSQIYSNNSVSINGQVINETQTRVSLFTAIDTLNNISGNLQLQIKDLQGKADVPEKAKSYMEDVWQEVKNNINILVERKKKEQSCVDYNDQMAEEMQSFVKKMNPCVQCACVKGLATNCSSGLCETSDDCGKPDNLLTGLCCSINCHQAAPSITGEKSGGRSSSISKDNNALLLILLSIISTKVFFI